MKRGLEGEKVLVGSSISGTEDTWPLDPNMLERMKSALKEKFPESFPTAFELMWANCVESISRLCTYHRSKKEQRI